MSYSRKSFGTVISRIRTERELSQERFSALAGISRSHLTMLENGKKTVRLDTFFAIAEALNMPAAELMRLVEAENDP